MKKFKIQRTRKPWLHGQTKRLFHLGDLFTRVLHVFATYSGGAGKEAETIIKIENRAQDTRLKAQREALVVAQAQRLELLNIEKRLELESRFPGKVAPLLGEENAGGIGEFEQIPHTI